MIRKALFAVLAVTTATGCSTTSTMEGIMSSWMGAHMDEVVQQWGYPASAMPIGSQTVYTWSETAYLTMPAVTQTTANVYGNTMYATSTTTGGGTSAWTCTRMLAVDERNYVVRWQWQGNNCPFGEVMQYANWRRKVPVSQAPAAP